MMKNVRDAGFSRKRGGNAGSGPSLPDPDVFALLSYKSKKLKSRLRDAWIDFMLNSWPLLLLLYINNPVSCSNFLSDVGMNAVDTNLNLCF